MRLGLCCIALAACAGPREVSKIRYTSTDCPDPAGCSAPLADDGASFSPPDEAHDQVADAAAPAPPPSCATVATALTAIELGNYASDETEDERTQLLAKHARACEAAKLDARELACVSTATAIDHVAYCTRKLAAPSPRVALVPAGDCATTVSAMANALRYSGHAQHAAVFEESCKKDGWPVVLAACFTQPNNAYLEPLQACREHAPSWLFEQIQARLDQAVAKP